MEAQIGFREKIQTKKAIQYIFLKVYRMPVMEEKIQLECFFNLKKKAHSVTNHEISLKELNFNGITGKTKLHFNS
jgi:hypothetical protein